MTKIRNINVQKLVSVTKARTNQIMERPYMELNLRQYSLAVAKNPYQKLNAEQGMKKSSELYSSIRNGDMNLPEEFRKYDVKGNLTETGKYVRMALLQRLGLGPNTKALDFFAAENISATNKEKEALFNKAIKLFDNGVK